MATIKIKQGNEWIGIDALKGDPGQNGENGFITAGSNNLPVTHLIDGSGMVFTVNDGNLTIDNDIRASIRNTSKATNGRPGGEKAIRDALEMQNLIFPRAAYNLNADCITPGFYPLAKNTTNYPSNAEEYGCLMVVPHYPKWEINSSTGEYSTASSNGQLCTQLYFTDGNDGVAGDAIFYRGRNTNSASATSNWEPWKRLLTNIDLQTNLNGLKFRAAQSAPTANDNVDNNTITFVY